MADSVQLVAETTFRGKLQLDGNDGKFEVSYLKGADQAYLHLSCNGTYSQSYAGVDLSFIELNNLIDLLTQLKVVME